MCDQICDVITCSVRSCDKGEINAFDKIICENQKQQRKYGNKRNFYKNLRRTDRLDLKFIACSGELMPEEALTSFTVFDAYR